MFKAISLERGVGGRVPNSIFSDVYVLSYKSPVSFTPADERGKLSVDQCYNSWNLFFDRASFYKLSYLVPGVFMLRFYLTIIQCMQFNFMFLCRLWHFGWVQTEILMLLESHNPCQETNGSTLLA